MKKLYEMFTYHVAFKEMKLVNGLTMMAVLIFISFPLVGVSQEAGGQYPFSLTLTVSNFLDTAREDALVFISEEEIFENSSDFNPEAFIVTANGREIPSQYNRHDSDYPGIVLVMNFEPEEAIDLSIKYKKEGKVSHQYAKRTQAEISHKVNGSFKNKKYIGGQFVNTDSLRIPDEHTDHSNYIRYEGPGWESDKVGYRFYMDWRNAVDVFGKKTDGMVLQDVGQDGFSSYHEMAPWGMDVMKVGESLGIGTIAYFEDDKARRVDEVDSVNVQITEDGPVFSSITTQYFGWKVAGGLDLRSQISIHAGSRLTHQKVHFMGDAANLCTGIRKDEKAKVFNQKGDKNSWGYLATYGSQSLNNDNLGVVIFFAPQHFIEFTEDGHSHIVRIKEVHDAVEYYYAAAWELEPEGIKDEASFLDFVNKTAKELSQPITVSFK